MPPAYVEPYVKRQKNDMADAEAICEAVARANMFRADQDARTAKLPDASPHTPHVHPPADGLINSIRAHLAEFGIVAPVGAKGSRNSCMLWRTRTTSGCRRLPEPALPR